jgi:hypothetical protein
MINELPFVLPKEAVPCLSDEEFAQIWFALLEQKSSYERDIQQYMKKSHKLAHKYGPRYVSNSPDNVEDQAMIYASLAQVTKLLDNWTDRATDLKLF